MGVIIFWIFLSILVGVFASSKKRSGLGWFFLSLIISPLITFIIILIIGQSPGSLKKCPKCAEQVKVEARVCRFCGFDFPSITPPQDKPEPAKIEEKITQETIDELWRQREAVLKKKWG